jgi:uncharacterized repeat protein (TIGR03803 family)
MTSHGGGSDRGVIFKINTDGTGYKNIHNFTGTNLDGRKPYGSLVVKGSIVKIPLPEEPEPYEETTTTTWETTTTTTTTTTRCP